MATDSVTMSLRRRPPPEALRWVERSLGRGVRVTSVLRLRAGTSAAVHLLRVRDRGGVTRSFVLRRFVRQDWLEREPDLPEREVHILGLLARSEVAAPRFVAADVAAAECDVPAVLMTRLPGGIDLAPFDLRAHVGGLAAQLPAIHAVTPDGGVPDYHPYFEEWPGLSEQSWWRRLDLWRRALEIVSGGLPAFEPVFIHRDYHPGNVLWRRGRVSGITDWVNASVGPRGVDVAHCAINLAELHGVRAAEEFRRAWESAAGMQHDLGWTLVAMFDRGTPEAVQWRDAGRAHLRDALMVRRREAYLDLVLRQLG